MPVPPLAPETVTALVEDATAAPSMHNAQPWTFRFLTSSRTFELRSDLERAMPHSDPTHWALHLGCAAALFNLRVAAAHAGWEPATRLLPDPEDPRLLATVRLDGPVSPDDDLAALYPAIHRRHTSRTPFEEKEIPKAVQDALCDAARREGAQLSFPSAWHIESLLDLVQDAEGRNAADPAVLEETAHWTRVGAAALDATDGLPEYAFGPRQRYGKAPMRDFAGRRAMPGREAVTFEKVTHLALLGTAEDQLADWLRAGQAMERVLLTATLNGLVTSLTSQALESPDLRWIVRDPLTAMGYVHMVIRLGYGAEGPGTPRRPVQEVLSVE